MEFPVLASNFSYLTIQQFFFSCKPPFEHGTRIEGGGARVSGPKEVFSAKTAVAQKKNFSHTTEGSFLPLI